jgi:hypothetical protein
MADRYFLSQDHDCHWYLVPMRLTQVWSEWLALDGDDEKAWTEPEGVIAVNGAPDRVTFEKPRIGEEVRAQHGV